MIDKNVPQVPDTSTAWQLWYRDSFDRDAPPSLQSSGVNIIQGLYQLWFYTLREGVQDNGSASFSSFQLTWGNRPSTRVDILIDPFHNVSLLKLRQWAKLISQHEEDSETGQLPEEQTDAILSRLSQRHYDLLQRSHRWKAGAIEWSAEAKELLERVKEMINPEEL